MPSPGGTRTPDNEGIRAVLYLGLLAATIAATVIGVNFGWRWVLAPLLGWMMLRWLLGSLRALVGDTSHNPSPDEPVNALEGDARTLFWCEECGTEVLLVVRGSIRAPSHCGQRMHERTELAN